MRELMVGKVFGSRDREIRARGLYPFWHIRLLFAYTLAKKFMGDCDGDEFAYGAECSEFDLRGSSWIFA
jgi:hypothetical protein